MATKKQPKVDLVIDGLRIRVYAVRGGYEVIYGDDADIADKDAYVMCYPKIGDGTAWAHQARLDYMPDDDPHSAVNRAAIDKWQEEQA